MITQDLIFDTRVDTQKLYVSMRTKFILRTDSKKTKHPLYLHITGNSKRERLNLDLHISEKMWDEQKQRMIFKKKEEDENVIKEAQDTNLILDNILAKITNIKTVYRLSEKVITPILLKRELMDGLPRVNFCSYYQHKLEEEKKLLKKGTYKKHEAVLKKLKRWREEIIFTEIDEKWFKQYRLYLKSLGNVQTTINSNIASIKKFMLLAEKDGIKIRVDLDTVKRGSTSGTKTALKPNELKKIFNFFNSEFINDTHRTIIGYFLFCCMTGLRYGDVMRIKPDDLDDDYLQFISEKSGKNQTIALNKTAKRIIDNCPGLFRIRYTNEYINRELKKVMLAIGIKKKVTFHVSRHTFATSYLRAGGRVEKLQILLGHSDIDTTMIYVHIVAEEANKDIHLMDDLL